MKVPDDLVKQWELYAYSRISGAKEQAAYIANRAAQWALEMAAKKCDEHAVNAFWGRTTEEYRQGYRDSGASCSVAIRAMMQEESDGQ